MKEEIIKVLKYNHNNQDIWIYSVKDKDENNNRLFKYYTLFLKNNVPVIIDLENPIETLQKMDIEPCEVMEDTKDYIVFMAYKDVAEKNIMKKIKR